MANSKARQRASKPDTTPKQDMVHPRLVWEQISTLNLFSEEESAKIDDAIRAGRLTFGFAKSGNGTKGTDTPDKPFTIARDETDPTKPVGTVSPVCATTDALSMFIRYLHVMVAIASYEHDAEKPRIYTKDGFGTLAPKVGLNVADGKRAQAYGSYTSPHTHLQGQLASLTFPPVPFSIEGTDAAPIRRTFTVRAYDPTYGPDAPYDIRILNPDKTEGEKAVSASDCEQHALKYSHLVFFKTDRIDYAKALSYYTTEEDVVASIPEAPPVEVAPEEPEQQELVA